VSVLGAGAIRHNQGSPRTETRAVCAQCEIGRAHV
jgi:hypothetical protein